MCIEQRHGRAPAARSEFYGSLPDLVGFARSVVAGPLRVWVEDMVVHAAYRQRGVETMLRERLLQERTWVETVSLVCKRALVPIYEARGFRPTAHVLLHRRGDYEP